MKQFLISPATREKLLHKHNVTVREVEECFMNMVADGAAFLDPRQDAVITDPPTQWFIAETDQRRLLKVVYVEYADFFALKTAFPASQMWCDIYDELCREHGFI